MNIIWSPTARTKIREILEYVAEHNPDAALRLIDQFEVKVENLKENPKTGRVVPELRDENIRELVVHKHYGIIYELSSGTIEILTVRHFRQSFSSSTFK